MHHPYYSTSPVAQYPSPGSPARVSPPIATYPAHAPSHPNSPPPVSHSPHAYAPHPTHTPTSSSAPAPGPMRTSRDDVSTAMHNLILAMKQIQETLRLWSLEQASPEQVSDCFMQFGVEFNVIVRAFEGYGIGTGDLHPIPAALRSALENLLGEDPSPAILAMYMPEIRGHLYELLQGLRAKQGPWKAATRALATTSPVA